MANTILERGSEHADALLSCNPVRSHLERVLRRALTRAREQGEVAAGCDIDAAATLLVSQTAEELNGAVELSCQILDHSVNILARRVYAAARRPGTLAGLVDTGDGQVVPFRLDITKSVQVRDAVAEAGDVDLLVNNAGVAGSEEIYPDALALELGAIFTQDPKGLERRVVAMAAD